MTLEQLNELMDEFYGPEDEEGNIIEEDGVYADNYLLAEWARDAVPSLFEALYSLLNIKESE